MKVLKAIVVLAVLIGIIGAAYCFIMRPRTDQGSNPELSYDTTEELTRIDGFLGRLSEHWNDTAYAMAKAYISDASRKTDLRRLQDHFYTGLFKKIDTIVVRQCLNNATKTKIDNHPILSKVYRGLDSLTNDYQAVREVERLKELRELKTLYDDIYAFSTNTFVLQPQLKVVVIGTGANTRVVQYSWGYKEYETYSDECDSKRQELKAKLNSCEELKDVRWMKEAVSKDHFDTLVSDKAEQYRSTQRRDVIQKFSDIQRAAGNTSNSALTQQLSQMHNTFPEWMLNDSQIEDAYRQLLSQIQ